jgi:amino acid transporter
MLCRTCYAEFASMIPVAGSAYTYHMLLWVNLWHYWMGFSSRICLGAATVEQLVTIFTRALK